MYLKRILTYSILSLIALGGFFGNIHIETQDALTSSATISYESIEYAEAANFGIAGNTPRDPTPASDPKKEETTSSASVEMYNNMIDTINIILAVLSAMISPIILFVGWLMSPDWTSGDIFGLRTPMYKLWVTISNIVYFIYAILLILIALGTMFGQDKFSYKVMLPKLALGILMVPFTWWFVQWTISISSVVTASVMTIPAETIGANDSAWFIKKSIPKEISIINDGNETYTEKDDCEKNNTKCISPKDFLKESGGMYGPLIVYGYSVFKFEKIKTLDTTLDVASAALKIVHTSIVSTIMFAVFGLLTLALAAMLLVRAIKLWMYAIFAPLFTFRFVAGSNLMGGDDDSFTLKEFIGLAFVPAIVGLTLSFGLVMINAVSGPGKTNVSTNTTTCDLDPGKGSPCIIKGIFGDSNNTLTREIENYGSTGAATHTKITYGAMEFNFYGKAINQSSSISTATGAIDAVGGMFGTIIIDVIALVFIWMAFMAAKNVSKAVKMAVEPFEKIGSQVGSLAKSIPKYTPLPLPGGSISSMGKVAAMPEQFMSQRASEKTKGIEESMGKLFGVNIKYKESDSMELKNTNGDVRKVETKIAELHGRGLDLKSAEGQRSVNDMFDAIKGLKASEREARGVTAEMFKKAEEGGAKERMTMIQSFYKKHEVHNVSELDIIEDWKNAKSSGGTAGAGGGVGTQSATWKGTNAEIKHENIEITLNNINKESDNKAIITALEKDGINLKGNITTEELKSILGKLFSDPKKVDNIITALTTKGYVKPEAKAATPSAG